MKTIICIILIYYITASAQSCKIGFDFEIGHIIINNKNDNSSLSASQPPLSCHINLSYQFNDCISFQAIVGRSIVTEFLGWEYGVNVKYKFYKPLFLKTGFSQHSNEGDFYSNQLAVSSASILMIQIGIGVDIVNFFSIGLDYYIPTSKQIIVWRGFGVREPQTFEKMIRLGFNFGWDL